MLSGQVFVPRRSHCRRTLSKIGEDIKQGGTERERSTWIIEMFEERTLQYWMTREKVIQIAKSAGHSRRVLQNFYPNTKNTEIEYKLNNQWIDSSASWIYVCCILRAVCKTRVEYTVTIDEAWFYLYRQLKRD